MSDKLEFKKKLGPATLCLRKKTFSRRPRKPLNPVLRPYTGARNPVSGPVH